MQFKTVSMLVFWRQRNNGCRATGHSGFADGFNVVPSGKSFEIEGARSSNSRAGNTRFERATDALGEATQPYSFLCRTIKLQQTLLGRAIRDAVPDPMGRKTTVAFVNKGALIALLLINLRKTVYGVLRIISLNREGKPSAKQ
ncbi:hypothetical protein A584_09289 [Pseudomonas syringae pv. theae ICMP 3923]|nr:hypothetical protein A584_09289 [Pseudomonas syringae pv. theae ICMP 3923]